MDSHRARGLPPKLGIKKRKPRASAVVDVANGRARKDAPTGSSPGVADAASSGHVMARAGVRGVAHLSKHQQAAAAKAGRAGGPTEVDAKRKGLRHFAVRVSRKVEEKSVTTYNEVADELVVEEKEIKQQEMEAGGKAAAALQKKLAKSGSLVDEKNIRRRVYDSLNVLMAMGIIEKDKKLISWRGLAMARGRGGHREAVSTQMIIEERRRAMEQKRALFVELEEQATTLAGLIRRNAKAASRQGSEGNLESGAPSHQASVSQFKLSQNEDAAPFSSAGASSGSTKKSGEGLIQGADAEARNVLGQKHHVLTATGSPVHPNASALASLAEKANAASPLQDVSVCNVGDAKGPQAACSSETGPVDKQSSGERLTAPESFSDRISIPFIIVATGEDSQIELEMDQLREDVSFTFSSPFAVFDDREILRRMNVPTVFPQG